MMMGVSTVIWIVWLFNRAGGGLLGTEVMIPVVDVPISDGDVLLTTGVVLQASSHSHSYLQRSCCGTQSTRLVRAGLIPCALKAPIACGPMVKK
jgi:hypothetical protein